MIKSKVELLAPAAGLQSVTGVMNAGADAVYIGGARFGARAYADNLNEEDLKRALDFVHLHDKKLYLTVNTLLKEKELNEELVSYLAPYYEHGLDAVIVQDIGVLNLIRRTFPDLPVHASTQMTITGKYGVEFLAGLGVKRVVTARELSLHEIREIKKSNNMELESFIHGALCYCYSGQCFFSSFIGGRSGNRGRCAQPCRLPYQYNKDTSYLLSPKDMCTIDMLPEIIAAGIFSLKIEGRMKRPEYAAGVTSIYRKYLDVYLEKGATGYYVEDVDREKLFDLYNRGGFHTGYYKEHNGKHMISMERPNHNGTYAGDIKPMKKGMFFVPSVSVQEKDLLEVRNPSGKNFEFTADRTYITGKRYTIPSLQGKLNSRNSFPVFRIKNESLLQQISDTYIKKSNQIPVTANVLVAEGRPVEVDLKCGNISINLRGAVVQSAQKSPVTEEQIRKQLQKTGSSHFFFEKLHITMYGNCFITMKDMNQIRRHALEQLEQQMLAPHYRKKLSLPKEVCKYRINPAPTSKPACYIQTEQADHIKALLSFTKITGFYLNIHTINSLDLSYYSDICHQACKKLYLVLPAIFRQKSADRYYAYIEKHLHELDGIVIKNIDEYMFLQQYKLPHNFEIVADYTVYAMNHEAQNFWKNNNISRITLPVELNKGELKQLCKAHIIKQELILYGYLPMMVSAQCLVKNTGSCKGQGQRLSIRDRMGKRFSVENYCEDCYNVIYNSEPLSLSGMEKDVLGLQPDSVRLNFTTEDTKEAVKITEAFVMQLYESREGCIPFDKFTRGHFKRGVE